MGGNQSPFYKRVSHHSVQTAPQEPAYDGMKNTGSSRDDTPVWGWEEEEERRGSLVGYLHQLPHPISLSICWSQTATYP